MQNILKNIRVTILVCLIVFLNCLLLNSQERAYATDCPAEFTSGNNGAIQPKFSEYSVPMASMLNMKPNKQSFGKIPNVTGSVPQTAVLSKQTDPEIKKNVLNKMKKIRLPFIENRGQLDKHVAYYIKAQGGDIYLTHSGEMVFAFTRNFPADAPGYDKIAGTNSEQLAKPHGKFAERDVKRQRIVFKISPDGVTTEKKDISVSGRHKARTVINCFKGKRKDWLRAIPTYNEVVFDGLFQGTRVIYKAGPGMVEDVYELAPGADPSRIRFKVEGAQSLRVDKNGALQINTAAGEFTVHALKTFQDINGQQVKVASRFIVDELRFGIQIDAYNPLYALIIDPQFVYGTFLGGPGSADGSDQGYAIAVDTTGNAYIVGATSASNYPTTTGVYSNSHSGLYGWSLADHSYDILLSVIKPGGNGVEDMLYSTFIGGSKDDRGYGVVVEAGKVYITGATQSADFPTTTDAYDLSLNSAYVQDAFLCVLEPAGNGAADMLYSTFLGGYSSDYGYGIAVEAGKAYVTGYTGSTDYPTTANAYVTSFNGAYDTFLSVIDPAGNGAADMLYSTYMGSGGDDKGYGIAVETGKAYITGYTNSFDFPTTVGAYETSYNGTTDLFLSVINPAGNGTADLLYSTFLGGTSDDECYALAIESGKVYLTGYTVSSDFPTTVGAYATSHNGYDDAFLCVIDPAGNGSADLLYSTFLGGTYKQMGRAVAVNSGKAYVTGFTWSNFPTTANAYNTSHNGGAVDAFLSIIHPAGNGAADLLYSTFLGGSSEDKGNGVAVSSGKVYVTGFTSRDFPTTTGAYDTSNSGDSDAFLAVIDPAGNSTGDLLYSTFLGGNGREQGFGVAVEAGKVYVMGCTQSPGFPTMTGAYDISHNTYNDIFLSVIDPTGNGADDLLYATFIGGSSEDYGYDITVESGKAYMTGYTQSSDFPTTAGAYDTSYNVPPGYVGSNAYLIIINPAANGAADLLYSTFLGANNRGSHACGYGVAVESGKVYLAGHTESAYFPTTTGAYNTSTDTYAPSFLSIINPAGNGAADLLYSTFISGKSWDYANDVAVEDGKVYVTGRTNGLNAGFPTTVGAYNTDDSNWTKGFLSIINPAGNGAADLLYSTFIGGSSYKVAVESGKVYMLGMADSNFVATANAFDTTHNGNSDALLSVINPAGNSASDLLYATFLGGSSFDYGTGLAVEDGKAYVMGVTLSPDFPTTKDAFSTDYNNYLDTFLSVIDPSGNGTSDLLYSTFIGGKSDDTGGNVAVENNTAYVVGHTTSSDFPTTAGAYDTTLDGEDAFLAIFTFIEPEINLKQGETGITDGGSYDFGSRAKNTDTNVIFTIENRGIVDLTLTTPLTIVGDAAFSIQAPLAASPVEAGNSTTFTVRFRPASVGLKTATISIANNDSNENPYDLTVTGEGIIPKGDLNGDRLVDLIDAIIALQVLTGQNPSQLRTDYAVSGADVNGDNRVGTAELIYILQNEAELR